MEEAKQEGFLKPHFPLFSHPFLLRYQPVSYLFFLKLGSFIQFKLGSAPNAMNSSTMILLHSQCHHRRLGCYNFYSFLFTFFCGLLLSLFLCCWTTPPTVCCSSRSIGKTMEVHICLLPFSLKIHVCLLHYVKG